MVVNYSVYGCGESCLLLALKDVAIVYTVHVLHALYYGHIHTSVTFSIISFLLHSLKVFGFAIILTCYRGHQFLHTMEGITVLLIIRQCWRRGRRI